MRPLLTLLAFILLTPTSFAATFEEVFKLVGEKKYKESIPLLTELIESANETTSQENLARAEYHLGTMYLGGKFIKQDMQLGLNYLNKSIEKNHMKSALWLTEVYRKGYGFKKDMFKSEEYLIKGLEIAEKTEYKHGDIHNIAYEVYKEHSGRDNHKELAMKHLNKSASLGYNLATLRLAVAYDEGKLVKTDNNKAAQYFEKAGEIGYHYSYFKLASYAEEGLGPYTKKDILKSTALLEKSAKMGNVYAMADLGERYYKGELIPRNYTKAIKWLEKGNEKNNKKAKYYLADATQYGNGTKKNLESARLLFGFARYKDSSSRSKAIQDEINCPSSAETKLFGIRLQCAKRSDMMAAIKKEGAKVIREDTGYYADTYNSSDILEGSTNLNVFYIDSKFVSAEYKFPGRNDKKLVTRVKDMVSSKYGHPDKSNGRENLGTVEHEWTTPDGITLKVYRGWPNTTTYLEYIYPKTKELMTAAKNRQKKRKEQAKYTKQAGAF